MKGMAGFGSTLASNKFVRAAVREEVREFEKCRSRPSPLGVVSLLATRALTLLLLQTLFATHFPPKNVLRLLRGYNPFTIPSLFATHFPPKNVLRFLRGYNPFT